MWFNRNEQMSLFRRMPLHYMIASRRTFTVVKITFSWNRRVSVIVLNWKVSSNCKVTIVWRKFIEFCSFLISFLSSKVIHRSSIFSFALSSSGAIFELCLYSGSATRNECPENIVDFIITTTNDECIEILALTQDSKAKKSLKVFDYPSKLNANDSNQSNTIHLTEPFWLLCRHEL